MNDKKQQTEVTGFIQRFHNQCTSRVVDQFANNLSWHFATILKNTFNRGEVLYNPTTDQFVWRDTDDTEYTIDKSQYMSDDCVVPAEYLTEEQLHGIIFPRIYPYQEKWLAEGMEVQTQELQKMFGESYTKYTPLIEFNNRMYFNLTEEDEEGFMIFTAGYVITMQNFYKLLWGTAKLRYALVDHIVFGSIQAKVDLTFMGFSLIQHFLFQRDIGTMIQWLITHMYHSGMMKGKITLLVYLKSEH